MKCAKFGTVSLTAGVNTSVNISDLHLTDPSQYMILFDGSPQFVFNGGDVSLDMYISSKTATSFTIFSARAFTVSYQVITFK
jgi:hypothetical protein